MKPGLTAAQKDEVTSIIRKHFPEIQIYFFGSRTTGKFKPTSDLDICLDSKNTIDLTTWAKLESDLSQSNLPFKVDIVDWARITPEFRDIIQQNQKDYGKC